jgi:hypothetical protein
MEIYEITDQIEDDFGVLKGTLELMTAAAQGEIATIDPIVIPVIENLHERADRIEKLCRVLDEQANKKKTSGDTGKGDTPEAKE